MSKQRPQTAKVANPFTQSQPKAQIGEILPPKAKSSKNTLLYKDYTIKEERASLPKSKPKLALTTSSDLKTTSGSTNLRRPTSLHSAQTPQPLTAHQLRTQVDIKFNNFLKQVDAGMIADDDSLLMGSQHSLTKSEKGLLVMEQKQKRRQQQMLKTQRERQVRNKQRENLKKLEKTSKQLLTKSLVRSLSRKSREKEQEDQQYQKAVEMVAKHRPIKGESAGQELTDLRGWIEQQIQSEKLRDPMQTDDDQPEQSTLNTQGKSMTQTINQTILSQKDVGIVSKNQKTQLLKHQLPGNNMLSEKEDAKLGSRQNRYGVFSTGASEFEQVVEIEREKMEPKLANAKPPIDEKAKALTKANMAAMFEKLQQRASGKSGKSASMPPQKSPSPDLSEDSLDQIPVRETSVRPVVNMKVKEDSLVKNEPKLPGVTETKKHAAELDAKQKAKESKAAQTIQKWVRGYYGRKKAAKQLMIRQQQIEDEYGEFSHQYKNQKQYNLKKYFNDKQRIRRQAGLDSIVEEIAEAIGESSGSAPQISMTNSLRVNNFFASKSTRASEFDPHSLISIYARKNGKPPTEGKEGPSSKIKSKKQQELKVPKKNIKHSSSEIVEDIYSEKFSEIQEDIIDESIPVASSMISSKKKVNQSDSIIDEIQSAAITGSNLKETDSVIEDNAQSAIDDSIKEDSIAEDSIIRDQFQSDNIKVSQASKKLEAQQRHKYGAGFEPKSLIDSSAQQVHHQSNQQQAFFLRHTVERDHQEIRHKNILHEAFDEMRAFEAANINSTMMDRMEKIVVSSLAHKDQIIMAQSLAEAQRELRHKEEINRIREDQIKLMAQLLLLGGFGGGAPQQPSAQIDQQRQQLYTDIQSMIQQSQQKIDTLQSQGPVNFHPAQTNLDMSLDTNKPVPLSHQQLYQQSQKRSQTYLDEYDQSIRSKSNKFQSHSQEKLSPARFTEPSKPQQKAKDSDDISEDSYLKDTYENDSDNIQEEIGVDQSLKDSIRESIRESIKDDIVESITEDIYSESHLAHDEFDDLKRRKLKQVKEEKLSIELFSSEVEKAIDRELQTKMGKLDTRFKQRKVSPRTYQRQRGDLEQWARDQRYQLRDQYRQLVISKPSPKVNQERLGYSVDSSDDVQKALIQTHLFEKGLVGQNPEQKSIQRKEELADRLQKEKDRAIQAQFEQMKQGYQREQADQRLKNVIELDVDEQAKQMFEQYKKTLEESQSQQNLLNSERSISNKPSKNVRFADTVPQSSVASTKDTREKQFNQQYPQMQQPQPSIDESIEESIQESLGDSYSQSFRSQSLTDPSKSKSDRLATSDRQNNKPAPAPVVTPQPFNSIEDNNTAKVQQPQINVQNVDQKKNIGSSQEIDEDIDDDYSEDFNNSMGSQQSKLSTSKKLQNKAQQLKESAKKEDLIEESIDDDYENDQFDESIGQSVGQSQKLLQSLQEKRLQDSPNKMDSVKEESSEKESPVESQSRHSPELVSLPSDDHTIHSSVKDIDWQINVPQDSQQEEEEVEESINERTSDLEYQDDFESNPENISGSKSLSKSDGDILGKADRIAQELLDLILAEYKGDNNVVASTEKVDVDEEDFKDKFPYTLDKKEPEIEMRPPQPMQITIANKPEPKKKTEKELADEAFMKKHDEQQASLKDIHEKCSNFLEFMVSKIDLNQFILSLDTPVKQNPLVVLANIQAYDDDEEQPYMEDEEPQKVLSEVFFERVDKEYQQHQRATTQKTIDLTDSQNEAEKITNVHDYALFEALNEALDLFRPYKNRGGPMPWSSNTRVTKQSTTMKEAKQILDQAVKKVLEWEVTGAGSKFAPLPPPPTQTQDDYGEDIIQPPLAEGEEDRRNQNRQEKLGVLMTQYIQENDQLWIDYEVEDTQCRFDLADMILSDLAQEIADILSNRS